MLSWLIHSIPVPLPAPSPLGFLTTYALLCGIVVGLVMFFPHLRCVFGFTRTSVRWFLFGLGTSLIGLIIVARWGTLTELPIGFVWSAIVIAALTTIRLALLPFVGDHRR